MKLIILDRDGVINFDSPNYIKSPDEWQAIPGSLEAIAKLNQAGFTIAVASNQSGISRGHYTEDTLTLIHQKMHQQAAAVNACIDKVFYCPHHPDENCSCRKPKPGLLYAIADHYQTTLTQVPFIGDRLSDVNTAIAAGARPILLSTGYLDESEQRRQISVEAYHDLSEAAAQLIREL